PTPLASTPTSNSSAPAGPDLDGNSLIIGGTVLETLEKLLKADIVSACKTSIGIERCEKSTTRPYKPTGLRIAGQRLSLKLTSGLFLLRSAALRRNCTTLSRIAARMRNRRSKQFS